MEVLVAASSEPDLISTLREELRDGSSPRVEGRRLVEQTVPSRPGRSNVGPRTALTAVFLLLGVFALGWRRLR